VALDRCEDLLVFFFSSRRRHTRSKRDWSSDVCSSDLHGTPSGIDNTLATFGQPILYNKAGVAPRIRELQLARSIPVVIGLSGVQTLTAQTVADIRAAWQRNPQRYESIFTQIDGLAQAGAQALEQGELEELGDLMNIDQGLL